MSSTASETEPARVLILWADDRSANLGVRALALGTSALVRGAWGDDVIIVHQDLAPNQHGFNPTIDVVKRDMMSTRGPIRTWLRNFDAVVDTGAGDSFADIYGWRRAFRMMYVQVIARNLGIPVVMAPQTIGPFVTLRMRLAARLVLRRASIVATRDSESAAYSSRLGRKDVVNATDVVFALPIPAPTSPHDVLVNVSGLLWTSEAHGDRERYRAQVRALIGGLAERGRHVALLAHVLANASEDNDVPVVLALGKELGLEVIIPVDLDEVRSVVAGARLVVGARMHACLNALSAGTPAIAWAYSRKFAPLLADIGWPHTVELRDDIDAAKATLTIVDSNSERDLQEAVGRTVASSVGRITPLVSAMRQLQPRSR